MRFWEYAMEYIVHSRRLSLVSKMQLSSVLAESALQISYNSNKNEREVSLCITTQNSKRHLQMNL